jgi:hypothetical protein
VRRAGQHNLKIRRNDFNYLELSATCVRAERAVPSCGASRARQCHKTIVHNLTAPIAQQFLLTRFPALRRRDQRERICLATIWTLSTRRELVTA